MHMQVEVLAVSSNIMNMMLAILQIDFISTHLLRKLNFSSAVTPPMLDILVL